MNEIPFCPQPFEFLSQGGNRFLTCCPGWMDDSRFVYENPQDLWEVWNHPILVEWREALLVGNYKWCQRCPNRFRENGLSGPLPHHKAVMKQPPRTYQILDDPRCNLRCPSCRPHHIHGIKPTRHPLSVLEAFPDLEHMAMSLTGDPFVSPECLEFMQTPGPTRLVIWTNGILLPKYWDTIQREVSVVVMSIDAAEKETYEYLRQPAKWEHIQETLRFMRDHVDVPLFQTNFVVQERNFRQMIEFVIMSLEHGAHKVQFCTVAPWDHITPEQWDRMNVFNPSHPDHEELRMVLQHPMLKLKEVDMGLMSEVTMRDYGKLEAGKDHLRLHQIKTPGSSPGAR